MKQCEELVYATPQQSVDSSTAVGQQRGVKKVLSLLAAAMPQAAVPEPQTIVIDTETTGLTDSDELLQISVIDDAGTVLFDSMVRPYFHTEWPQAQNVNGITPEMVAGAPYPHELLPHLVEIFSEVSTCIGYNVPFDLGFLDRIGVPIEHLTVIDVMKIYTDYRNATGTWQHKRLSLANATKYFDYHWDGDAHNSLADAKATLYCYNMLK